MFTKRKDTDRLTEAVLNVLRRYEAGDIVPHSELEAASGCERGQGRYYSLIRRARERHCDETGTWTREVPGVGFRFLTPLESITEEQRFRNKRARRQLGIGHSVAAAVPDTALTDHERRLKQHVLQSKSAQRKQLLDDERHGKWLGKSSSDKPIKVVPPRLATGTE